MTMRHAVWMMGLGLSAASAALAGTADRGAKPLRSLVELRDAQLVRQHWELSCGAAAVATLMTYQLHVPTSEHDAAIAMMHLAGPLRVRLRLGFSLYDLKRFAAQNGFAARGYAGLSLADLLAMTPALVPIRSQGLDHFVVVQGARADRVLLADPAFGNRTVPASAFLAAWTSGIGFVIQAPQPVGGVPPPGAAPGTPADTPPDAPMSWPAPPAIRAALADARILGGAR